MKNVIFFLLLFGTIESQAQNTFFIGNKTYFTTSKWTFETRSSKDDYTNFYVAKDGNKGLFIVSVSISYGETIGGPLMIYLADNSIIQCKDRGVKDVTNGECTTIYYLTPLEIEKMKKHKIMSVRYNIMFNNKIEETFISKNKYQLEDSEIGLVLSGKLIKKELYDTELEIQELFN